MRQTAGSQLRFIWTPSHLQVKGNDEADARTEEGRERHSHNKRRWQQEPVWAALGLSPMRSEVSSSMTSSSEPQHSVQSDSTSQGDGFTLVSQDTPSGRTLSGLDSSSGSSGFSTDVSERQRLRKKRRRGRGGDYN